MKLDKFLNPARKRKLDEILKDLTHKYKKAFQCMNMKKSYEALLKVLWHSSNPCFDIRNWTSSYRDQKSTIKRCTWKGFNVTMIEYAHPLPGNLCQVKCSAIFKPNPTDRGMCCTFNALAAEKLYRESKFAHSVSQMQKQNSLDSFEASADLPNMFETIGEPSPDIG